MKIEVWSGAGKFFLNGHGGVITIEEYYDGELEDLYPKLKRFDLREYREWRKKNKMLDYEHQIDITHISYWTEDGTYVKADDKCREEYLKNYFYLGENI